MFYELTTLTTIELNFNYDIIQFNTSLRSIYFAKFTAFNKIMLNQ